MPRTSLNFEVVVETDLDAATHEKRVNWIRSNVARTGEYMDQVTVVVFQKNDTGEIIAISSGGMREPSPATKKLLRELATELGK